MLVLTTLYRSGADILAAGCGAILGSAAGCTLSLKMLASFEHSTFTALVFVAGMTATGAYAGWCTGYGLFHSPRARNALIESVTHDVVDSVNKFVYGR